MNLLGILLASVLDPQGGSNGVIGYNVSSTAPRILINNSSVLSALQSLKTSSNVAYTNFKNLVDTEMASPGSQYQYEETCLYFGALIYVLTGTTSYAQYAHDHVMTFIASEEALIAAGTAPVVAGDSYLDIGPRFQNICMTFDWCKSFFTLSETSRIVTYLNTVLTNLWNPSTASWGGVSAPGAGWAINQPSDNYYYSFLMATFMVGLATYEDNNQAQSWLDWFRITKVQSQLTPYFGTNIPTGGSQEGTGYGLSLRSLFTCYYLWKASTSEDIASITGHTKNTAYWFASLVAPGAQFVAPIGDLSRDSTAAMYDYHLMLSQALFNLYPTDPGARALLGLIDSGGYTQDLSGFNYWANYFYAQPSVTTLSPTVLNTCFYGQSTSTFSTRSGWGVNDTYLYQQLGVLVEYHAHEDQSSFGLWKGGWLFDDAVLRSESGLTRHVACHNQVLFYDTTITDTNPPGMQGLAGTSPWMWQSVPAPDTNVIAIANNANFSYTCCDTAPKYNKPQVVVNQRELLYLKPNCFVIFDRATSNASTVHRQFSLNMGAAPSISGNTLTLTRHGHTAACTRVSPTSLSWQTETFAAVPTATQYVYNGQYMGLGESWDLNQTTGVHDSARDYSIRAWCEDSTGTSSLFLHVISLDSDVTTITANNTSSTTGVNLVFADGRTASVSFNNSTTGGTLVYTSATSTSLYNGALPTGISVPSLLAS